MANTKKMAGVAVVALFALAVLVALFAPFGKSTSTPSAVDEPEAKKPRILAVRPAVRAEKPAAPEAAAGEKTDAPKPVANVDEEGTDSEDEDKRADKEEALVEAFDNMTDRFMETEEGKEIAMEDVKRFHDLFKRVPEERKEECLHRALNLLPDENVMLLAGILMDKEEKKELVELVFNDVLNRDESVKKILLGEIYKDKSHPCWADTAWILDVTGKGKE